MNSIFNKKISPFLQAPSGCACGGNCGCKADANPPLTQVEKDIYMEREAYVGKLAPEFELEALMPDGTFGKVSLNENAAAGKWTVLYFYPADFTFVCPTEIKALSKLTEEFTALNANVIACSVDSIYVHAAWVREELKSCAHPIASDQNHCVSKAYGVYDHASGIAWRGLFIIGPDRVLWSEYTTYKTVGRSANEALRLLKACQLAYDGKFVPCDWEEGSELVEVTSLGDDAK